DLQVIKAGKVDARTGRDETAILWNEGHQASRSLEIDAEQAIALHVVNAPAKIILRARAGRDDLQQHRKLYDEPGVAIRLVVHRAPYAGERVRPAGKPDISLLPQPGKLAIDQAVAARTL